MMNKLGVMFLTAVALGACAQVSPKVSGTKMPAPVSASSSISRGASDDIGQLLSHQYQDETAIQEASAEPTH